MKEAFEKILERLEGEVEYQNVKADRAKNTCAFEEISVFKARIKMAECYEHAIEIVNDVAEEFGSDINVGSNDGWIPVEERLPEDGDSRFYMCIVENHEDDLPMFCQFEEEHGFGYWRDFYDEYSLGFVDSEFSTNEELGYEKVVAWMPLPEPYKKGE